MKKILKALVIPLLVISLLLSITAGAVMATPGLVNPGFDTGDLTGWSTVLNGGSATAVTSWMTYNPQNGSHFALLKTDGGGSYTTISQSFSTAAGTTISGCAFFYTSDFLPYDDKAHVRIMQGETLVATPFSASVGTGGSTLWTDWQYTFTAASTYTVEAGVANWLDTVTDSYMGLDALVLTSSGPKALKQNAIAELSAHAGESKHIDEAIKHLDKSLDEKLWVDGTQLVAKHGAKVFNEEKKTVKELMHLLKKDNTSEEVKGVCQSVIDKLIEADDLLAHAAYEEASLYTGNPKVDKELEKCDKEFEKVQKELDHTKKDGTPNPKYDNAIKHYKNAWKHAQKALGKVPEDDEDGE